MTFTLGWKSGVVLLVLLVLGIWGGVYYFMGDKPDVVDLEQAQIIKKADSKIRKAEEKAEKWEAAANEAVKGQVERDDQIGLLSAALRKSRKQPRTMRARDEQGRICCEMVPLLQTQVFSMKKETIALRKEVVYLKLIPKYNLEKDIAQDKRLKACKKDKKITKRKAIIRDVIGGAIVYGLGISTGKFI